MAQDRVAYFNVPGIFSPHRLTIRYPATEKEGSQSDASAAQFGEEEKQVNADDPPVEGPLETGGAAQAGEKRKEREADFLQEEIALNALELAAESEVSRLILFPASRKSQLESVTETLRPQQLQLQFLSTPSWLSCISPIRSA